MFKRLNFVFLVLTCVAFGTTLNLLFAVGPEPNAWKSLEKSYAVANLELAEARLEQANSQNQTVAESVSQDTIDELKIGVQLAQGRLKQLESGNKENPYGPQIKAAEDSLTALQQVYAESTNANKLTAGTIDDAELRREKAEIAVAQARLAALKSLDQQPPEVRVQWELDQLHDQIRALWARPLIED
jgi:hypothetical protein